MCEHFHSLKNTTFLRGTIGDEHLPLRKTIYRPFGTQFDHGCSRKFVHVPLPFLFKPFLFTIAPRRTFVRNRTRIGFVGLKGMQVVAEVARSSDAQVFWPVVKMD